MSKMLVCSAIVLAGLTTACASRDGAGDRRQLSGSPMATGYGDTVYVDSGYREPTYRETTTTVYRDNTYRDDRDTTYRNDSRWSSQPSGPATTNVVVNSPGERYRDRWDGLTLGQRYAREQGRTYTTSTYVAPSSTDGRYWDGENWRLPDGRYWDGSSWRR